MQKLTCQSWIRDHRDKVKPTKNDTASAIASLINSALHLRNKKGGEDDINPLSKVFNGTPPVSGLSATNDQSASGNIKSSKKPCLIDPDNLVKLLIIFNKPVSVPKGSKPLEYGVLSSVVQPNFVASKGQSESRWKIMLDKGLIYVDVQLDSSGILVFSVNTYDYSIYLFHLIFYVSLSFLSRTILDFMITTVDLKKQLQNLAKSVQKKLRWMFHGTFRHLIQKNI
jgi:hypothetical protein